MNTFQTNIPIVMPIDTALDQPWLVNDQILQTTIKRFSENINFVLVLPNRFSYRCLGQQICRDIPSLKDRTFVGAENLWQRLFQVAQLRNTEHVIVVPENACGMPLTSIALLKKLVHDPDVDLVSSDQIVGLLPSAVSKKFLLRRLAKSNHTQSTLRPLRPFQGSMLVPGIAQALLAKRRKSKRTGASDAARDLTDIYNLQETGDRVHNVRFFRQQTFHGPIRYLPQLPQDRALAHYLLQHCDALGGMLQRIERLPLPEESDLFLHLRKFCDTFAVTYPVYQLTGEPDIPEETRALTSNPKSVGDCYLRAINFTRFLKGHAGLNNTSRVLDVGCGWGLLALGLVNVVEAPGSYLGLDIQQEAIAWAEKNIAPLNARFSFLHLDISNTRYNPLGSIPYDQVRLPIESDSVDLVVFSSVFTHMRREGVEQYLRESRRVLRGGGIAAFSYFHSSFFGENEDYRVRFPDNPDRMTLFSTREIHRILLTCGLVQARPQVNYGGHFNSEEPFFQTFMFATR